MGFAALPLRALSVCERRKDKVLFLPHYEIKFRIVTYLTVMQIKFSEHREKELQCYTN
jgi:hypothetical protein